jgi:hypothetical protein
MARQTLTAVIKADAKDYLRKMSRISPRGLVSAFGAVSAGIGVAAGAFAAAANKFFIQPAIEMEGIREQFKVLLGDTAKAEERMKQLTDFAAKTPFELPQIAEASKLLQVMGGDALATGDMLRLVGDAASSTADKDFANLATWVGRAYSGLKSNRPVGEAMMRLMELGLISGDTRNEIEKLQKQGKGMDAFDVLKGSLGKFSGTMAVLSQTTAGKLSTLRDNFRLAGAEVGDQILPSLNVNLDGMIQKLQEMKESGDLKELGENLSQLIKPAADLAAAFGKLITSEEVLNAIGTGLKGVAGGLELINEMREKAKAEDLAKELAEVVPADMTKKAGVFAQLLQSITGAEADTGALITARFGTAAGRDSQAQTIMQQQLEVMRAIQQGRVGPQHAVPGGG